MTLSPEEESVENGLLDTDECRYSGEDEERFVYHVTKCFGVVIQKMVCSVKKNFKNGELFIYLLHSTA